MKKTVFLKDIPELKLKAFGRSDGKVQFVTDEFWVDAYDSWVLNNFDLEGKDVIHVEFGTDVRLPIPVPVAFYESSEEIENVVKSLQTVTVQLEQYHVAGMNTYLRAGSAEINGETFWVVQD